MLSDLDRAVDLLVEMKNSAEVAVGLAYSALLFNDQALAAEVGNLEARSDDIHDELESWVLRSAQEARNPDDLRGLIRLAHASEAIFDSAREMARLVEKGRSSIPSLQPRWSSPMKWATTVIAAGSAAEGKSIKELAVETETGMFVLAVQRGRRWTYRPKRFSSLRRTTASLRSAPPREERSSDHLVGMVRELADV